MSLEVIENRELDVVRVYRCDGCGLVGTVWEYKGRDLCDRCLNQVEKRETGKKGLEEYETSERSN